MADASRSQQGELVLSPNEYAHVQDRTKGEIATYVGPITTTLSGNDILMTFDLHDKRFKAVEDQGQAKQTFITAPAGWYILLQNPTRDNSHPRPGTKNSTPDTIEVGKKIVVPGPCNFALWPGQTARVIQGHRLRSNEYLVIEVYDQDAARDRWKQSLFKTTGSISETVPVAGKTEEAVPEFKQGETDCALFSKVPADLANGKQYIVRGDVYSFFIPPTGVKVVPDTNNRNSYIRQAITLEKLEYAVLLDENGQKEYVYGAAVVFPRPTQHFVTQTIDSKTVNKFRAYELDARTGVYVKVIEEYEEDDPRYPDKKRTFHVGEELFITGPGQIYFPRKEHAIIRHGDQDVHHAIAIPKGEGRYVLDRDAGGVKIVIGERMFLPDARKEVITRRILSDKEVELLYPGNEEALRINKELRQSRSERGATGLETPGASAQRNAGAVRRMVAPEAFAGDSFDRRTEFTAPRTVILDTKYEGAVTVRVFTGYAVKVNGTGNKSRVVQGPNTLLLEYDEMLEPLSLSTGKPKTTDRLLNTVYLRVTGNLVSDIVKVTTKDLDEVSISLSYRVNFEGEDLLKWFSIENYVKWLCDHARSRLKAAIRKVGTMEFNNNATEIIRNVILGASPGEGKERMGMRFAENGMRVYDVEVLGVKFVDDDLEELLHGAQRDALRQSIQLDNMRLQLTLTKEKCAVSLEELTAKRTQEEAEHKANLDRAMAKHTEEEQKLANVNALETAKRKEEARKLADLNALEAEKLVAQRERESVQQGHKITLRQTELDAQATATEKEKLIANERRIIVDADHASELKYQGQVADIAEKATKVRVEASAEIAKAFSPQLIEALQALTDTEVLKVLSAKFGDLGILRDQSVLATAERFLGHFPKGLVPVIERLMANTVKGATDEIDPARK